MVMTIGRQRGANRKRAFSRRAMQLSRRRKRKMREMAEEGDETEASEGEEGQ